MQKPRARREASKHEILGILRKNLGTGSVFSSKREIESHSFDALRLHRGYSIPERGFPPDYIVMPRSTKQIITLLEIARKYSIPLTPRGGGTGLMGGAAALRKGIVVDFQKMSRVLKISQRDETVVVQPGASIGSVNGILRRKGLILGHDPWTRDYATVGGAISTNGLGFYGGKYGSMGDQVLGLKAVLADGTEVATVPVQNSSTGFDLKRLFIGTEGTFGLITEATLRCFPIPESEEIMGFTFPSFEVAYEAALKLREEDLGPASLSINGDGYGGPCEFYIVFAGSKSETRLFSQKCRRLFSSSGGKEFEKGKAKAYWKERHGIADMYEERVSKNPLSSLRGKKSFDFVHVGLAPSKVVQFKRAIMALAKRRNITIEEYGIWIKPELFNFNFTREDGVPVDNLERTVDDSVKFAMKLGGTIEYCHGAGFRLASFLPELHGKGFEVMKKIKRELDPEFILNPGKLGF
jgi:FAD/FMN-containing dehydrogenase